MACPVSNTIKFQNKLEGKKKKKKKIKKIKNFARLKWFIDFSC